jgi:O-antigen/teichoic acid export membrane protein
MEIADIKSSRNYIFLNFFTILVPVILYPFITKIISPESYGFYIFTQAIASLVVAICNFGSLLGFKRNYFEYKSDKEKHLLLTSIQIFFICFYLTILLINFLFIDKIFSLSIFPNFSKKMWTLILITTGLDFLSKYYLTFLVNEQKSKVYCSFLYGKNFFYVMLALFFFYSGYEVLSLVYSLLISNSILVIIIFYHQIINIKISFKFIYVFEVLKISYPMTLRILFGQLDKKIDKILITIIYGASGTGIYAIAQSITYSIFQLMTSLDKVFITKINKKLFAGEHNIKSYLTPFLFISAAATIFLILFNDVIYFFFIDQKYYGVKNLVIIFSIYYFSLFFSKVSGAQLVYLKKIWLVSNLFFLNLFLNFILNLYFIRQFGLFGAGLSTLISSLLFTYAQTHMAQKLMKFSMNKKDIFIICLSVVAIAITEILINNYLSKNLNIITIVYKILIFSTFIYLGKSLKLFNFKKVFSNLIKIK